MTDNFDLMQVPDNAKNANGGTELMTRRLFDGSVPREILEQCQIIPTRISQPLDETKIRIYVVHDLPGDPSCEHLKAGGWNKFHRLVFVSNWQMQAFIKHYKIPWSRCVVIQNAIEPIEKHDKPEGKTNLMYFSTPHRGLQILVPVFKKMAEENKDIHLNVYSSFKLYGWEDRDEHFQELYKECEEHEQISYHGAVSNEEIRKAIQQNHILAYPSIWEETSCLVLMEAMSGGLLCAHPNLAALPETAANWTNMYQFNEDANAHAGQFFNVLKHAVSVVNTEQMKGLLRGQKQYADAFYNWNTRKEYWTAFLSSLLNEPREIPKDDPGKYFHYRVV